MSLLPTLQKRILSLLLISGCGFNDIATSEMKFLTSPNWPMNYTHDLNCQWRIEASDGCLIRILFDHTSETQMFVDVLVRGNAKIQISQLHAFRGD